MKLQGELKIRQPRRQIVEHYLNPTQMLSLSTLKPYLDRDIIKLML